jgi:WD40 repeat protein
MESSVESITHAVINVDRQIVHIGPTLLLAIASIFTSLWPFALFSKDEPTSPVLVMQTGHDGFIRSIDISSDGKIAVTGADDSSIRIWSLPSGIELRRISTGAAVRSVALSPDGRSVAAISYQRVTIWDVESGARQRLWSYFASNPYVVPGVAFTRDGKSVVAADEGRVFVWSLASSKPPHVESFRYGITCFAAQPGIAIVALCQKDTVVLWNTESFKTISTIGPPRSTFPIPSELASAYRDAMKQGNAILGKEEALPDETVPAMVMSVDFAKDLHSVVTNHIDVSLRIWKASTGDQSAVALAEIDDNLAVDPLGESFAVATDEKVVVRSLFTGKVETQLVPPKTNQSGVETSLFSRINGKVSPLRYTPDGTTLVEALVQENRLVVWDLRSHRSIHTTQASIRVPSAFVSDDHQHLYSITGDVAKSWNLSALPNLGATPDSSVSGVSRSKDGAWIAWDTAAAFEVTSLKDPVQTHFALPKCRNSDKLVECDGVSKTIEDVMGFSLDDRFFFIHETDDVTGELSGAGTSTSFYAARANDGSTRTLVKLPLGASATAAFCPERNVIAWVQPALFSEANGPKSSAVRNVHIFDVDSLKELQGFTFSGMTDEQVVQMVSQAHEDNPENFKDLFLGRVGMEEGRRNGERVSSITFSADGSLIAAAYQFHGVTLWHFDDRRLVFQTGPHIQPDAKPGPEPTALAFSPDGRWLIAGWNDGSIRKFDTNSGAELAKWTGHDNSITSVSYSPQGKLLISTGQDGTIRFWNPETNTQLLTVLPGLSSSDWVVVAPNGLFDGGADGWPRVLWRFRNSIFDSQPIEVYFREYFHPGLLRDFFSCIYSGETACARIRSAQSLSTKNRVQPIVDSISIVNHDHSRDTVSVVVQIRYPMSGNDIHRRPALSEVFEVRLLRDGQLVAEAPSPENTEVGRANLSDRELKTWRLQHAIKLDASGKATIPFKNIRLPQREGVDKVEFSAYGFNSDRVKSITTPPLEFAVPKRQAGNPALKTAFLLTMGVNANQSRHLNLELAVSSAESARSLLRTKLLTDYSEVVEVPLYSDFATDSNQVTLKSATKADLRAALGVLAGRFVDRSLRDEIDPKHQLRVAGPDDAVILYVASHGYDNPHGVFYLIP